MLVLLSLLSCCCWATPATCTCGASRRRCCRRAADRTLAGHLEAVACLCAHPAHEHRAISQARGPAARTQRALKLATAALAATAGVPAPKPHLPAGRLASALTLCASDSVGRCQLQRCELPILMLMLALPTIGLLALRCVDALAPLFILLFSFFDLLTIGTLISQPAALPRAARCSPPSEASGRVGARGSTRRRRRRERQRC